MKNTIICCTKENKILENSHSINRPINIFIKHYAKENIFLWCVCKS